MDQLISIEAYALTKIRHLKFYDAAFHERRLYFVLSAFFVFCCNPIQLLTLILLYYLLCITLYD